MADYKKMYHIMFNAATDAERLAHEASEILRKAQQECENLYMQEDIPLFAITHNPEAQAVWKSQN